MPLFETNDISFSAKRNQTYFPHPKRTSNQKINLLYSLSQKHIVQFQPNQKPAIFTPNTHYYHPINPRTTPPLSPTSAQRGVNRARRQFHALAHACRFRKPHAREARRGLAILGSPLGLSGAVRPEAWTHKRD